MSSSNIKSRHLSSSPPSKGFGEDSSILHPVCPPLEGEDEVPSGEIEKHPWKPYLPQLTRILFLGSFPPSRKRWCVDFFYPNFNNDFWRIFGLCLYDDKQRFVDEEKKIFRLEDILSELERLGVGLYDTASAVIRTRSTASDKDLEVVVPTDLDALLRSIPQCAVVVTTGQKATELFTDHFAISPPRVGESVEFVFEDRPLRLYRMPSSSRAYPMKVERKAEYYKKLPLIPSDGREI